MRFSYLGNFGPAHSTENHVARALIANGHKVIPIQEGEEPPATVAERALGSDVFLWTQTYGLALSAGSLEERLGMLEKLRANGIPSVGYHLDRWWGLARQDQVDTEAFFRVDLLCTADGGHDAEWAGLGINHRWFPPGVSALECDPGQYRSEMASEVAFVGSWQGGYHPEWSHRPALVEFLRSRYGHRVRFWPEADQPAVRGPMLRDLYASVRVLVGDSCLVGSPSRYWSDRIPETLGRGGYLLHPRVDGLEDHYENGRHLRLWSLGDWDELDCLIDCALRDEEARYRIAQEGRAHVLAHHTYEVRMRQLVDLLGSEGLV